METLYTTNSTRINLFKPDSTTVDINIEVEKLLKSFDKGSPNLCPILVERMARRTAAILHTFKEVYNLSIRQVEELLELNDLRKSFACKGVDLLELMNYYESNDSLLADQDSNILTTVENFIIKITQ